MTDDRVSIKVPPDVHAELKVAKDMDWPDQLLHWKRMAEAAETLSGGELYTTVHGFDAAGEHNLRVVLKDVLEELGW